MKQVDFAVAALNTAASAAAASAAAVARAGLAPDPLAAAMTFGLLALSGACAVAGALFYRAHESESSARDALITVIFPFIAAFAAGPTVGALIFAAIAVDAAHHTALAEHMVGGLAIGVFATPALRVALRRFDKIGGE